MVFVIRLLERIPDFRSDLGGPVNISIVYDDLLLQSDRLIYFSRLTMLIRRYSQGQPHSCREIYYATQSNY